jgi:hypothetical protein
MGLTRKFLSVSTMGAVDFRSDKERTAAYTQRTRRESIKQTKLMQQDLELQRQALAHQQMMLARQQQALAPAPQAPPAGWYPDAADASLVRWWDGAQWTAHVQPRL